MSLVAGTRLGPYEILSALGAGGMGEVWRAHDTKLGRDVALKLLPHAFVADPERVARFQREARTLASLNHPNIGGIYGLEEADGRTALVLELVEGPTLADRIAQGPMPVEEALPIARQIAEALEAAHEHGIIHRDLKPANIKVRSDGTVKVLDFGLAKGIEGAPTTGGAGRFSGDDLSRSPTITTPAMTHAGIILGTAAYMSPEQAKGKFLDKRTDVWAFGCVLYEMLAGRRAFEGDDVSDTMASVLKSDPDWAPLPADTPPLIRRLLRRCLTKDRKIRIPDIAVARFDIDDVLSHDSPASAVGPSQVKTPAWRRAVLLLAVGALGASIAMAVASWTRPKPTPPDVVKFKATSVNAASILDNADSDVTISPDGKRIVYVTGDSRTTQQVIVRALNEFDGKSIGGVGRRRGPFVSPDGQWVGYSDGESLMRVPMTGGAPMTICKLSAVPRGASWGVDGTIVFATNSQPAGLFRVAAAGGAPETLTTPDTEKGEVLHELPEILPGGRAVLFTIVRTGGAANENRQVALLDLATRQWRVIIPAGSNPRYAASGHVLYASAGTLRAVPFDLDRLEVRGDSVPVVERLLMKEASGAADFSVSGNGTLVYVEGDLVGGRMRTLVWVDREGHEEPIKSPPRAYAYARLSPDGNRVALDIRDQESDIWIWDLARETLTRLTTDPGINRLPVWTPNGKRVAFSAERDGVESVYWQAFDGSGTMERLSSGTQSQVPMSFSPDGTQLIVSTPAAVSPYDIGVISVGGTRTATMLLNSSTASEMNGEISPDGRWLAYESNESGRQEIYVRPFPNVEASRQLVSTGGGTRPLWSHNGRELFYFRAPDTIMAVSVQGSTDITLSSPQPIVKEKGTGTAYVQPLSGRHYDVSADGKRFLLLKEANPPDGQKPAVPELHVVINWSEELKQRMPTK